ncbi:hydroxyacid dehydrogenase [Streptomyces griseoviridis]|uniref:Hydroxyacid dehydrogenase n=1 Tax=Streptomyces hintoniae TaxID=3075521 RepID=A0ABU2UGP8_9ACTN|nr:MULTISPECIES: hydroxyacid dehydrogenase [unclassified Streptomyces]MDH6697744.1 D-3-phosphoglycerate dehydrogenase [Streptomyces sp. MAA16]MDT0472406.1 hydroxyacid dehydrogenase [Streptomyces sp. DSM 41014]
MPTPIVIVSDALPGDTVAPLKAACDVRQIDGRDRQALLAALPEADALIVRSGTRVDAEVLERATRLRVVARAGVGLDNVDTATARALGVTVVNAPDANSVSVAELTVSLVVASVRHLQEAGRSLRAGEWRRSDFAGTELSGRTAGIVGFGRVGRQVARRLAAFDMRILVHDPYADTLADDVHATGLDELLAAADVVTLHLPRTPTTTGLIGARELRLMKPTAHLVNTARGGIVDESALYRALCAGTLAGAALDVFATEPPGASPLLDLPNVVAVPHLGASTAEAQLRAGHEAVRKVLAELAPLLAPAPTTV